MKRQSTIDRENLIKEKAKELRAALILSLTEHMSADQVRQCAEDFASLEMAIRERINWQADKRKEPVGEPARVRLAVYIDALQWVLVQMQLPKEKVEL